MSFDINTMRWGKPTPISNLNSELDDYAPAYNIYDSLLYYSSAKTGTSLFYTSDYTGLGFSNSKLLKSPINLTNKNQNYISFYSPNLAYFTSFRKSEMYSNLCIYKSFFAKNSWSIGVVDDILNVGKDNAQLSISPDKTTAVFISNKDNDIEDTDLWMTQKNDDGDWSNPIKLDELNTSYREITPFLKSSDTLFFASDGLGGPGAFDLYCSIKINGVWQRPTPLFDLNTEFNESDICILPDNTLIFSSDRAGGSGGLDLYLSKAEETIFHNTIAEEPTVSILTQTNTIQAERNVSSTVYPFPIYIPISFFETDENNDYYLYLKHSLDELSKRMDGNPSAILQISNSPYNSVIEEILDKNKRLKGRIIFSGSNNKYILLKSTNKALFDFVEMAKYEISLKPPALDISINSSNNELLTHHSILLNLDNNSLGIDVHNDTLPIRFIYDLEPFANKIFNSDSLSIIFKYSYSNINNSSSKRMNIIKSENKSSLVQSNLGKYIDYNFYLPDGVDFSDYINSNENYLNRVKQDLDISSRVLFYYYTKDSKAKASQIVSVILKAKKYIELGLSPSNESPLPNETHNFFKLRIFKY